MTPVNKDLSKELHEAGVSVESEYFWVRPEEYIEELRYCRGISSKEEPIWRLVPYDLVQMICGSGDPGIWFEEEVIEYYPAPLSCELAEVLPRLILDKAGNILLTCIKYPKGWLVCYKHGTYDRLHHQQEAPTLADAMALMLLHLKKEELI